MLGFAAQPTCWPVNVPDKTGMTYIRVDTGCRTRHLRMCKLVDHWVSVLAFARPPQLRFAPLKQFVNTDVIQPWTKNHER